MDEGWMSKNEVMEFLDLSEKSIERRVKDKMVTRKYVPAPGQPKKQMPVFSRADAERLKHAPLEPRCQ